MSMGEPLILGRISAPAIDLFFNNMKFFGNYITLPSSSSTMVQLLLRGKMAAGPVTSYDSIRLQREGFFPLADFGLFVNPYMAYDQNSENDDSSALIHAPSVLMIKRPIEEFRHLTVGVSPEAMEGGSDSLTLLKILLSMHWEIDHTFEFNLREGQDAWLCQGGPYLLEGMRQVQFSGSRLGVRPYNIFPYAYDLAWEWYRWKKTPYVFYRWVCSPDIDDDQINELIGVVRRTLELNLRGLPVVVQREAAVKEIQRGEMLSYLQGFGHRLGLWRQESDGALAQMASLLRENDIPVVG